MSPTCNGHRYIIKESLFNYISMVTAMNGIQYLMTGWHWFVLSMLPMIHDHRKNSSTHHVLAVRPWPFPALTAVSLASCHHKGSVLSTWKTIKSNHINHHWPHHLLWLCTGEGGGRWSNFVQEGLVMVIPFFDKIIKVDLCCSPIESHKSF